MLPGTVVFTYMGQSPTSIRLTDISTIPLRIDEIFNVYEAYYDPNETVDMTISVFDFPNSGRGFSSATTKAVGGGSSGATLVLQPGEQYITSALFSPYGLKLYINEIVFAPEYRYRNPQQMVDGVEVQYAEQNYDYQKIAVDFPLVAHCGADFWETDVGKLYRQAIDAIELSAYSGTAIFTQNIEALPIFHSGDVRIGAGRVFEQSEYDENAKVCLISADMARRKELTVGDTITLKQWDDMPLM